MPLSVSHHDLLVVGLPEAGKSTYLAALWELLDSDHIKSKLRLGNVSNTDRTYLNRIRDQWLKCEALLHTSTGDEQLLSIPLVDATGNAFELRVPDLSGETFQRQWVEREWTPGFRDLAERATGCLLLVNPQKIVEPSWLEEAAFLEKALSEQGSTEIESPATPPPTPEAQPKEDASTIIPWSPEKSPTQVILVDLLQSLLRFKAGSPFKVAVIVSAWDLARGEGLNPDEWIRQRLPLLEQFLTSNRAQCLSDVFGVSAQWGDLVKDKVDLQNADSPENRLICSVRGISDHDISAPVRWLAELA